MEDQQGSGRLCKGRPGPVTVLVGGPVVQWARAGRLVFSTSAGGKASARAGRLWATAPIYYLFIAERGRPR